MKISKKILDLFLELLGYPPHRFLAFQLSCGDSDWMKRVYEFKNSRMYVISKFDTSFYLSFSLFDDPAIISTIVLSYNKPSTMVDMYYRILGPFILDCKGDLVRAIEYIRKNNLYE